MKMMKLPSLSLIAGLVVLSSPVFAENKVADEKMWKDGLSQIEKYSDAWDGLIGTVARQPKEARKADAYKKALNSLTETQRLNVEKIKCDPYAIAHALNLQVEHFFDLKAKKYKEYFDLKVHATCSGGAIKATMTATPKV
jgi:hypothetical protein